MKLPELRESIPDFVPRKFGIRAAVVAAARESGCSIAALVGRCRMREVVAVRNAMCYRLLAENPDLSVIQLAVAIGRMTRGIGDHSSIIHAVNRHAEVHGLPRISDLRRRQKEG